MSERESINLSSRRVQRISHELKWRALEVVRVSAISPGFRSITFSGESLGDFVSASFDDHIKLVLDLNGDGETFIRRDYTPRHYDAGKRELTLEFALHTDGQVSAWAAQVQAGQSVSIGGPRSSFIVPLDYDWHLLVGDATALPAIARRLEELPAASSAIVILHVAGGADRRALSSAAALNIRWVDSAQQLIDATRSLILPGGDGYIWGAGEAASMQGLRGVLLDEKNLSPQAMRVAAYWKRGVMAHHEELSGANSAIKQ